MLAILFYTEKHFLSNYSDSINVFIWSFFPPLSRFILLNVLIMLPHSSPSSPAFAFSYWTVASEQEKNISDRLASVHMHKYSEVMMKVKTRQTCLKNFFYTWNSISSLLFEIIPLKTQKWYPRAAKKKKLKKIRAQQDKKGNACPVMSHRLLLQANHGVTKSLADFTVRYSVYYLQPTDEAWRTCRTGLQSAPRREVCKHSAPRAAGVPLRFVKRIGHKRVEASHRFILATRVC